MRIKQSVLLPILLTWFLAPALAQNSTPPTAAFDTRELIGIYVYNTGFVGASYVILSDGKYEYGTFSDCCDPGLFESGSYALRDNVLHFKGTTKTLNRQNFVDPETQSQHTKSLIIR